MKTLTYSILWNLFLITFGSLLLGIGIKSVVIPHGLITGGFSGTGILLYYFTDMFSPGVWYMILNIPVFLVGWKYISRRFFFYSVYGSTVLTVVMDLIEFEIAVNDMIPTVLAGGVLVGAGAGIILRSLGSSGGNDIISIMLYQKYNIRIGSYNFIYNCILFLFSFGQLSTDLILYSMAMSFITTQVMDYVMTMFNQRKMIFIISREPRKIADEIISKYRKGATFLKGRGAYSGKDLEIIMTVVNNYQLKRIEKLVFSIDPKAFLIAENTFNVLGEGFSRLKTY